MKDLVSVIITTFKRSELLSRAINSVLAQTYENIEIIVVDDNEPNTEYRSNTEKLMSSLYSNEVKIHYLKMSKNSGACAARNFGVSKAKGRFINFLDDDDQFYPTKIEKQVNIFSKSEDSELSVVGCYGEIVNQDGTILNIEQTNKKGNVFFDQLCHNITTTSLALIRRDYYIESKGFEHMYSSQEHWMFAKIYALHPNYDFVPEVLVRINIHDGERISTNPNKPLGAIQLYENIKEFFPRFDEAKRQIIRESLLENIINAYLIQGRRKESLPYLLKRQIFGRFFSLSNFKISIAWFLGQKIYARFVQSFLH